MNVTFEQLCSKIGKLVIENELLAEKVQELTGEVDSLKQSIAKCPVQCSTQSTPEYAEAGKA